MFGSRVTLMFFLEGTAAVGGVWYLLLHAVEQGGIVPSFLHKVDVCAVFCYLAPLHQHHLVTLRQIL